MQATTGNNQKFAESTTVGKEVGTQVSSNPALFEEELQQSQISIDTLSKKAIRIIGRINTVNIYYVYPILVHIYSVLRLNLFLLLESSNFVHRRSLSQAYCMVFSCK